MTLSLRSILVAAAAAFAVILSGCATDGDDSKRTVGQFTDDATITARVKTAIARDVGAGAATNVNVTTYRGVVQLSGFVQSKDQVEQAAAAARKVEGVKNVENDVRVRPAS